MARKKKLFTYTFADGPRELPSSNLIKCTKTGEEFKMYHKHLVSLIENKYRNNWSLFKSSYIKKGNRVDPDADETEEYNTRPAGYRSYLITAYISYRNDTTLSESTRADKLEFIKKCYFNRWGEELEAVIQRSGAGV